MRRIVLIATLCLLALPVSAQVRSMGGRGTTGRPFFGSHGATVGNPAGRFRGGSVNFRPGFGGGFGRPFFGGRFHHHHHHFFGGLWGYGYYGYPAWGYGYYGYPWFADYSYSTPYYASDVGAAGSGEQARIEQRLDRIEERLDALLDRTARPAPAQAQTTPTQPEPTATLVFRDGHKEEIQNYAVVGHTLWVFTEERARKIPVAQINTEATDKANEQRGVDLHLPKVNN
jgi:hypothetical protein